MNFTDKNHTQRERESRSEREGEKERERRGVRYSACRCAYSTLHSSK